jgi:hypothetical protein
LSDWEYCLTGADWVRQVSSRNVDHCDAWPENEAVVTRKFRSRNAMQVGRRSR